MEVMKQIISACFGSTDDIIYETYYFTGCDIVIDQIESINIRI